MNSSALPPRFPVFLPLLYLLFASPLPVVRRPVTITISPERDSKPRRLIGACPPTTPFETNQPKKLGFIDGIADRIRTEAVLLQLFVRRLQVAVFRACMVHVLDKQEGLVFHSIRKTVVTILENAGVPENVVADIVGHEKTTMTYGLYSGGTTLAVKREALDKLAY